MPAQQRQRWQQRQANVPKDASAATTAMPKQRKSDVRDNASAAMTPALQWRQW
jgi:hypothetical protein